MTVHFAGSWSWWWGGLFAIVAAAGVYRLYAGQTKNQSAPLSWLLPLLRALAVLFTALMIVGPVVHHAKTEGVLGKLVVLLDLSDSMNIRGDFSHATGSRIDRAMEGLCGVGDGLLEELRSQHHVRVLGIQDNELVPLWDSATHQDSWQAESVVAQGKATPLGFALARADGELDADSIVLMSDGQHNAGSAPLPVAQMLGGQRVPIFTVGFGNVREPADVALLSIDHPQQVFLKNRLRGTIALKDRLAIGSTSRVQIKYGEAILWSEEIVTESARNREVVFDFPVEQLIDLVDTKLDYQAFPVELKAEVVTAAADFEPNNNHLPLHFMITTKRYKVLLVDGRSRWETRYLKNAFSRDEAWQLTTVLPAEETKTLPIGIGEDQFPADRTTLFSYNCIILGDLHAKYLNENQQLWIREFVEFSGGGLVLLDGARGSFFGYQESPLSSLFPVRRLSEIKFESPARMHLMETAKFPFLTLHANERENNSLWRQLPAAHWSAIVEPLAGSQTLITQGVEQQRFPFLVIRRFGAGQVAYFAADESWRWRYNMADAIHQRFWHQTVRWLMRQPLAVTDGLVSLDTGKLVYSVGETAPIKARLTDGEGRGVENAVVEAQLERNGQFLRALPLLPDENNPGFYESPADDLGPGSYQVRLKISGFPVDQQLVRCQFVVEGSANAERQRIACQEELLRQLAEASGGSYLPEGQLADLPERLMPLSRGRVIASETKLAESHWWFLAIMTFLGAEWWLRKRAGLL